MGQVFRASADTFTSPNGAIGHRIGGGFDCLGPFAKVRNCPIQGTNLRLTCYATGYADTAFSIPACTRHRGAHVSGFFTSDESGTVFVPHSRELAKFAETFTVHDENYRYFTRYPARLAHLNAEFRYLQDAKDSMREHCAVPGVTYARNV